SALKAIASGQVRIALFTNANQVENVMQVARDEGLDENVRAALAHGVVASVGPIASESLRNHRLPGGLEPPHPEVGPLVREASLRCHEILDAKRGGPSGGRGGDPSSADRAGKGGEADGSTKTRSVGTSAAIETAPRPATAPAARGADPLRDSPFLRACRREATSVTPIWL